MIATSDGDPEPRPESRPRPRGHPRRPRPGPRVLWPGDPEEDHRLHRHDPRRGHRIPRRVRELWGARLPCAPPPPRRGVPRIHLVLGTPEDLVPARPPHPPRPALLSLLRCPTLAHRRRGVP